MFYKSFAFVVVVISLFAAGVVFGLRQYNELSKFESEVERQLNREVNLPEILTPDQLSEFNGIHFSPSQGIGEAFEFGSQLNSETMQLAIYGTKIPRQSRSDQTENFPERYKCRKFNTIHRKIDSKKAMSLDAFYLFIECSPDENKGLRVCLVNSTKHIIEFMNCSGDIFLVQEALDQSSQWKQIEYHHLSWCGTSYGLANLSPNEYWSFPAIRYKGSFKTKLRFRLKGTDHVSNVFDGSVNIGQFEKPTGEYIW